MKVPIGKNRQSGAPAPAHKRLLIVISPFCCVLGSVIIFPALRMKNGISI